jgi:thiol-disulfide isomerase/thioredoxin
MPGHPVVEIAGSCRVVYNSFFKPSRLWAPGSNLNGILQALNVNSSQEELPEVDRVTKKRMLALIGIFIFLSMLFSSCTRHPSESEATVQIGLPAPNFKLPDLNGKEISLDQFKGRVVVLDFWATWCGPCRMTMPLMENLQKEYKSSMALLAIDLQESKDVVGDYVLQQGIHSQVLLDEKGSVGAAYGTDALPTQIIIDKEGIVRRVQAGFGPKTLSQLRAEIERLR